MRYLWYYCAVALGIFVLRHVAEAREQGSFGRAQRRVDGHVQVVIRLRLCFSSTFKSVVHIMVQRTHGHSVVARVSHRVGLILLSEISHRSQCRRIRAGRARAKFSMSKVLCSGGDFVRCKDDVCK